MWELPFTLQTVAVYCSGLLLSPPFAFLSQLLYLVSGLFFPVFAGDGYGIDYLFNTFGSGYLLSFPIVAGVVAVLSISQNYFRKWLALQTGSIVLFASGVLGLSILLTDRTWQDLIIKGWLNWVPLDQMKILISLGIYGVIKKYNIIHLFR
jgi:biotin transport system substrate-specific component